MRKTNAAASIVGGVLPALIGAIGFLALFGAIGFLALIVVELAELYSAGMALWLGLPLIFVGGAVRTVDGIAARTGTSLTWPTTAADSRTFTAPATWSDRYGG